MYVTLYTVCDCTQPVWSFFAVDKMLCGYMHTCTYNAVSGSELGFRIAQGQGFIWEGNRVSYSKGSGFHTAEEQGFIQQREKPGNPSS